MKVELRKKENVNNIIKRKTNQRGITLVALVVTIIVLIILAGVSINILIGENGIITMAEEAKKQQEIAEITEELELKKAEILIETNGYISLDSYIEKLQNSTDMQYKVTRS